MSLNRLDFGTTPNPVAGDWALNQTILSKAFQNINDPIQFVSTNVPQGATFQIGGIIYYGASDTAITGTPSAYVKLTPNVGDSGATCDAAFVANLTGVTWNKIYNGYYDVSGNLHIFDEIAAILASALTGSSNKFSAFFNAHMGQSLLPSADVAFNTINTGQGANDLYEMNQNVKTSSNVLFENIGVGGTLEPTQGVKQTSTYQTSSGTMGAFYTALLPALATTGKSIKLNGGYFKTSSAFNIVSRAYKLTSSSMRILSISSSVGYDELDITASTATVYEFSVTW